ncbi:hypothetical protein, variant [Aphanomyces invadans]|uniref:Dynactin subunit 2 n=1 Tax=Aphanomyces invadans TaxID=157072 RepID=A0A024TWL2_9STRA|nr:hypothetical protein, variant [Aphanomyces invadans]ETV98021.1 hypothetical protein, variant [Aphanomyces invadans]|eukprot:XP_008873582.1 hypothetical protein, variant [Aphanomyces invadans]
MAGRRILEETEVYETPEVEVYPSGGCSHHPYANIDEASSTSDMNEIDRAPLRPADAFHAFLGASVPSNSGELKVVPRGELETPTMRYHRLQQEMSELEADLELLHQLSKESVDPPTYRTMLQGLKTLQANLSQLQIDPSASAQHCAHAAVQAQQHLSTQLWKDIQEFRQQHPATPSSDSTTAGLVYEVYAVHEEDQNASLKLAAVEQRVAQLERLVGPAATSKSGPEDVATLLHNVQELEKRVSLLNPAQLATISSRVATLLNQFTSIAKLQDSNPVVQHAISSAQESTQLDAIYNQLQSVGATAAGIPALVDRITSVKALHDDAATFRYTLHASTCVNTAR